MLEERVPDRFWLGVPLHYVQNPPKRRKMNQNFNGGLPPFSNSSIYKISVQILKEEGEEEDFTGQ